MHMLESFMLQACRPSALHVIPPCFRTLRENLTDERHGEMSRRLDNLDPWGDWCEVIQAEDGGNSGG